MARLLLVEDDEIIGQALLTSLTAHAYEVSLAKTGRAALREAAVGSFDLVLLDLGLPDLDGLAVCRELRTAQADTVIVMLTARDEEMDVIIGLEAGADDYLTKPVRLAELHARIRAHLRRGESIMRAGPSDPANWAISSSTRQAGASPSRGTTCRCAPRSSSCSPGSRYSPG